MNIIIKGRDKSAQGAALRQAKIYPPGKLLDCGSLWIAAAPKMAMMCRNYSAFLRSLLLTSNFRTKLNSPESEFLAGKKTMTMTSKVLKKFRKSLLMIMLMKLLRLLKSKSLERGNQVSGENNCLNNNNSNNSKR